MSDVTASDMKVAAGNDDPAWKRLTDELDAWADAGRMATFWWRDDDAATDAAALRRLIGLSRSTGVPLALAVVPAWLQPDLYDVLRGHDAHVAVLQHGWAHINHARGTSVKGAWELGMHRGRDAVLEDVARGRGVLADAFREQFLPVMTPPWNKIAPALIPDLAQLGFAGVSTFGARTIDNAVAGMVTNNCHCDPVDWKAGKLFRGAERTLEQLIEHLRMRRAGSADAAEASGLLTHHLDMDEATWRFTERLLRAVASHPASKPLSAREVFAP